MPKLNRTLPEVKTNDVGDEAGGRRLETGGPKKQRFSVCQNRLVLPIVLVSKPTACSLQPPALPRQFREIQPLQEPALFTLRTLLLRRAESGQVES